MHLPKPHELQNNPMIDTSHILKPDAKAILLLCGRFSSHGDETTKPLGLTEYNKLDNWLIHNEMQPGNLLQKEGQGRLSAFGETGKLTEKRINSLLNRGTAMALFIEEWTNKGGWILARTDDNYSSRFLKRLRHKTPPVIYGVGNQELLESGGVSIVGSRDSDDASLSFVRDLARKCAEEGVSVVSGGARGVDQTAMDAALEAGGFVVGVLACKLAKTSRKKKYRQAIAERRLILISAFHPNAGFHVGNAMARNKYIYTLGDGTVVVHSTKGSGGTWTGAKENLKHAWVPLYVRAEPPVPEGNQKLIEMGGHPVDRKIFNIHVKDWLNNPVALGDSERVVERVANQSSLFDDENPGNQGGTQPVDQPEEKKD